MKLLKGLLEQDLPLGQRLQRAAFAMTTTIVTVLGLLFLAATLVEIPAIRQQANQDTARVLGVTVAADLGNKLRVARQLSASPLVWTALTDTDGREAYLKPFLRSLGDDPDAASVQLLDYRGRPLAGNLSEALNADAVEQQVAGAMTDKRVAVGILAGREGSVLLAIFPVLAPYTQDAIGALLTAVDLQRALARRAAGLGPDLGVELVLAGDVVASFPPDRSERYASGSLALDFGEGLPATGLTLHVHSTANPWIGPIASRLVLSLLIAAVLGVVFWRLSGVVSRRVTQRLDLLAEHCRAISEGRHADIPEDTARDEIGIL